MAGYLDHVARGLAEVPEKLRGPRIQAYLAVYLAQFAEVEDLAWAVLDALVNWQRDRHATRLRAGHDRGAAR